MELQEVLSVAIQYEREVGDHYAQCARNIDDPRGQRVFAALAREEQGHLVYLEHRLAELRSTGLIQVLELPTVLPGVAWIQAQARTIPSPGPEAGDGGPELVFLRQALELELKTSAFNRDLIGQLDAGYRGLFTRFLDIEDGHVALIRAQIDALAGQGRWLDLTIPG
jgi:rubrerythrin